MTLNIPRPVLKGAKALVVGVANQYSIAYNPTNHSVDGRYHKIKIDTPEHKGYQVRARRGYFAKATVNAPANGNPSGAGSFK